MTDKKTVSYQTKTQPGRVEITIETTAEERVSFVFDPEQARTFGLHFVHAAYEAEKSNG